MSPDPFSTRKGDSPPTPFPPGEGERTVSGVAAHSYLSEFCEELGG
jgi:hypothetical protein